MTTYQQAYQHSLEHPADFWREQAEQIHWFQQPQQITSQDDEGLFRWFRGGKLNTAYLALDFHVERGRGDQPALIYDSPVTETTQTFTYRELRDRVAAFAGVLRQLDVGQGDTVVIYMPMIPETIIAMLANMAGIELLPIKPGSATKPVCGYDIRILDAAGRELPPNEEGVVAVRLPLPPGCLPNLWNDTPRFKESYLAAYPGYYSSGDGGYKDDDGYVFITGRVDDIINVAGHRLSTATIEEVIATHPAVAECAVIGVADELKGQIPVGFVVLKANVDMDPADVERDLVAMVREKVGPVASFKRALVTRPVAAKSWFAPRTKRFDRRAITPFCE